LALEQEKIDAILLTTPADLGYVTGNAWEDTFGLLTLDSLTLISDFRYETELRAEAAWARLHIRGSKETMADAVAAELIRHKLGRVGFESNFTPHGTAQSIAAKLKEKSRRSQPPKLVPLTDFMVNRRKVKDAIEIEAIRRAIAVAQDAYLAVRPTVKPGSTENEIAGRMEYEMRRRGASSGSFETNVGSGPASALPHYRPRETPVLANQLLLFDWGARVGHYCSDITRTHAVGRVSPKLKEVYKLVLEAQLAAIAAIRPGLSTRAADKAARDVIDAAGYGKQFGHGLGHGIGLAIHELPRLSRSAKPEPLEPGMVVTVEPGIYLAGEGGVRIEDDVLVTATGCEVLTTLDKSFEGCHLE
jgi:Xaa-Pro aminopeptidase